jgi:hypothetical protein
LHTYDVTTYERSVLQDGGAPKVRLTVQIHFSLQWDVN